MENWPIIILVAMLLVLLLTRAPMVTVCPLAALAVLVLAGGNGQELLARAAPNIVTVFVVMTTTQLAIRGVLRGGGGEWISVRVAQLAAHPRLRRVPAQVILPMVFVPATMLVAMFLHNITAILVLAPLALNLSSRYRVSIDATLSAMLIASNLGGASMAFGDTPAIIQRMQWGFSPGTFAAAMLPRNLVVLAVLTAAACVLTWLPARHRKGDWLETLSRLKARDEVIIGSRYGGAQRRELIFGIVALAVFILAQFAFPTHTLAAGSAVLAGLILVTPEEQRPESYITLGLEAILVICSLFVVAGAVEHTPIVNWLAGHVAGQQNHGAIEGIAYLLTTVISADGAAATLAPVIHQLSGGTMLSAWQLACGICAGSSTLLTAASAGPIINSISRGAGHELTFRNYLRFGVPFSLLMIAAYLLMNVMLAR